MCHIILQVTKMYVPVHTIDSVLSHLPFGLFRISVENIQCFTVLFFILIKRRILDDLVLTWIGWNYIKASMAGFPESLSSSLFSM